MKNLIYVFVVIISLVALTGYLYYNDPFTKSPTTRIVVASDVTNSFIAKPNADEIFKGFGFKDDNLRGASLEVLQLTDVDYTPVVSLELNAESAFDTNIPNRIDTIQVFRERVRRVIDGITFKDTLSHSSIFQPLMRQLQELAYSKSDRKVLVVYGDLMSNTNTLSLYSPENLALISSNPRHLTELLSQGEPLPDLQGKGVEVYLIFQPRAHAQNEIYVKVSNYYKGLLESLGAKSVTISANLNL